MTSRTFRRALPVALTLALVAAAAGTVPSAVAAPLDGSPHWVPAWATAPQRSGRVASDQTYRQLLHTQFGGSTVRVRLSNRYGQKPVTFGPVVVGTPASGAAVAATGQQPVTFGGLGTVTVPAGGEVASDAVPRTITADSMVAVTLHVADRNLALTSHDLAVQTSYATPANSGDHTSDVAATAFTESLTSWSFVTGLDVVAAPEVQTVVTLGDSITDGYASTAGANHRYPDYLAARLRAAGIADRAVANLGISANRITVDGVGEAGALRLAWDALQQPGVGTVVLLEGINDIGGGIPTGSILASYRYVVEQAHARGVRVIAATLTPWTGCVRGVDDTWACSTAAEDARQVVNRYIRTSGIFDEVVDFDAATKTTDVVDVFDPRYNSGDFLHPNDAGYAAMADAVDLTKL